MLDINSDVIIQNLNDEAICEVPKVTFKTAPDLYLDGDTNKVNITNLTANSAISLNSTVDLTDCKNINVKNLNKYTLLDLLGEIYGWVSVKMTLKNSNGSTTTITGYVLDCLNSNISIVHFDNWAFKNLYTYSYSVVVPKYNFGAGDHGTVKYAIGTFECSKNGVSITKNLTEYFRKFVTSREYRVSSNIIVSENTLYATAFISIFDTSSRTENYKITIDAPKLISSDSTKYAIITEEVVIPSASINWTEE